jgi:ferredoxin
MKVIIDKCMHCGACVGTCPQNAIYLNDVFLTFNEKCNKCGLCVKTCPVGALQLEAKA